MDRDDKSDGSDLAGEEEDDYDTFNDETFGDDMQQSFDWDLEYENIAQELHDVDIGEEEEGPPSPPQDEDIPVATNDEEKSTPEPSDEPVNGDPYYGLMAKRTQYWLAGIQLLSIRNLEPYQQDYYYTLFQSRHGKKKKIEKTRHFSTRNITPSSNYTILQFSNSLGQISTPNASAPRRSLDTCVPKTSSEIDKSVRSLSPPSHFSEYAHEASVSTKWRTVRLLIERIYSAMLRLELAQLEYARKVQDPNFSNDLDSDASERTSLTLQSIHHHLTSNSGYPIRQYMFISKGKKMILRFLQNILARFPTHHSLADAVWFTIFADLTRITLADATDGLLPHYLPTFRIWIEKSTDEKPVLRLAKIVKPHLKSLLQHRFGMTIISYMVQSAMVHMSDSVPDVWKDFVQSLAEGVANATQNGEIRAPLIYSNVQSTVKHIHLCLAGSNDVSLQKVLVDVLTTPAKLTTLRT